MNKRSIALIAALIASVTTLPASAPYTELVPRYDRFTSNVMARNVPVPSLANLDYTAYTANPILAQREKPSYKRPAAAVAIAGITFGGKLIEVKDRLDQTPLTPEEKRQPFAWRPLVKRLWNVVKERSFPEVGGAINGYKWADSSVYQPYQEVVAAYASGDGDSLRLWLKIEFSPWVDFLASVDDEDKDGVRELYGMLPPGSIPADSLRKAVAWMRGDYSKRILTREEMTDWVTDLASYWYPTKNTDIVDIGASSVWPNRGTETSVVKTMAGIVLKNPVAVVKGKPFDPSKPIYNVYVVGNNETAARPETTVEEARAAAGVADTARSANGAEIRARLAKETGIYGTYNAWSEKNAPFRNGLAGYMATLPAGQMAFAGRDGWLFFRKSAEYVVCGDLAKQPADKNPLPAIVAFNDYLKKRGVNMLFVPVPCKEEVYFEKLPAAVPAPAISIVNPYGRKFLADLQAAGVEAIDLLPLFLEVKDSDKGASSPLYQRHDTHWTSGGLLIAAAAIARRVKEYKWYGDLSKTRYTVIDTTVSRIGDLVDKLPESERAAYTPATLEARQVRLPDGKRYAGTKESPVMLIGDSFTGQFELIDCKGAGVGAHVAAATGLGVEIITSWGGGPFVRKKAMLAREKHLGLKKLVIYMMADRDLFNYQEGWERFPDK